MSLYSTPAQLGRIRDILCGYSRLPFSGGSIPGAVMEGAIAQVRDATVLRTYDFVDVVKPATGVGWQVKATAATTPVTWKRAKIPDRDALIRASQNGPKNLQALGDEIIRFCNDHARESLHRFALDSIGYARLVRHADGKCTYFETELISKKQDVLFNPAEFSWNWSVKRAAGKKEQLQALHGHHLPSKERWWAWHGLGENQLHFTGERTWWPKKEDGHSITFSLPTDQLTLDQLMQLLDPKAAKT